MKAYVDLMGLDNLLARVREIESPDATPLMATFGKIIFEDNKRGVLAGTDKDGRRMPGVSYRPVGKTKKLTLAQKNTNNARQRKGAFSGFGPAAAGLHNNLARSEYEKLGGPPLAPRGAFSRVITNLRTAYERVSSHTWEAYGMWFEVVSTKGVPFLGAHFDGKSVGRGKKVKLPVRDLRGVRPEGREKARKAAIAWLSDQVRWVARGGSRRAA